MAFDFVVCMNRRKKGNQILKARAKKANAKLHKRNKPKYISKAEREKLAQQAADSGLEAEQSSAELGDSAAGE